MSVGVYMIKNLVNNKSYIGMSTVSIEDRIKCHFNKKGSKLLSRSIDKYGASNFEVSILEECDPDVVKTREQYWISYYDTMSPNGYNLTSGGEGLEGWYFTEEVRKEMSARTTLQRTGSHLSESTKEKIRNSRTGYRNSPEALLKMKAAAEVRFTEEVCKKISEANKNPSEETRQRMSEGQKRRYLIQDNPFLGKHHTDRTRELLSDYASKRTGELNSMYGKHHSDDTKKHISSSKSKSNLGRFWYTNGIDNRFVYEDTGNSLISSDSSWHKGRTLNKVLSSTTIESITDKKDISE